MFIQVTTKPEGKIKINIDQICWVDGNQIIMGNGLTITVDEASQKQIDTIISPRERAQKEVDKELVALFEQLHTLTGGKGKTVFSLKREKQLRDLLGKHRFSKEDLIRAATNIGKDDFLQGDNDRKKRYGTVDYLLRPDKAAMWSDEQAEKKKKGMF